jgi:hypothetical protein
MSSIFAVPPDQKDETGGDADQLTIDHDLGAFDCCIGDLFDHVSHGVEASESKAALKKA